MKKLKYILLLLAISTQFIFAQNSRRANQLFEKRAYLDAAELFLNETAKTQDIYQKLGDCYYFNTKMTEAATWYKLLAENYGSSLEPTYLFRYAQALKGISKFDKADKWLQKYHAAKKDQPNRSINTIQFFKSLNKTIKRPYFVHKTTGNSVGSDFGPAIYGDHLVFASTRNSGGLYDWNQQPYLDLFQAKPDESGHLYNIAPFSEKINTKMHESNAVFTKDGKTMYFTRNNFAKGKKGKDKNKVTHLKIYKAQLVDNEWGNIAELSFNSDHYSVEHPALSPDEKQLYFSSDMPGSIGSFDLFVVDIHEDGTYGTPKNLGNNINTEQREQFPFVSSNHTLYFASDGHFGMGGLDVFKSTSENGRFSKPVNLSNPINSSLDDFGFIIDEKKETGYFSSNRTGGMGDDDLYRFTQKKIYMVNGLVQNKKDLALLPGSQVSLFSDAGTVIGEMTVGDDGAYSFEIKHNKSYKISGFRELFNPHEVEFSTDHEGNINKNILLMLESYKDSEENIVVEDGKTQIKIDPVYFDFDKWNIRRDAALELDNVVDILKKYPTMSIEIGAHTDCQGSDEYNLKLSHKRAASVRAYLVSHDISGNRVTSVGYGETQPLNDCCNHEKNCSKSDFDLNRRCEFVIVK